jgi:hypothetical protein
MLTNKEIKNHQIQLSASDILKEYRKTAKPAIHVFPWKKFLYVAVPAVLVIAVATPLVIQNLNRANPSITPVTDLINNKEGTRISNAVVSSLYLLGSRTTVSMGQRMKNTEVTQEAFEKIVSTYDYADNLVQLQLNSQIESYQKAEACNYTGKYGTYNYLITIEGETTIKYYLNYSKEGSDVEFKGEALYNNSTYLIEGKNRVEGVESEYEYTASLDENNYMTIEEEKETDEYSYEYQVVKNGVELYTLAYSKSDEVELSFVTSDNEYSFSIDSSSSIWSIAYEDNAYEGTMTLERKNGQKIYTDLETKAEIVK